MADFKITTDVLQFVRFNSTTCKCHVFYLPADTEVFQNFNNKKHLTQVFSAGVNTIS